MVRTATVPLAIGVGVLAVIVALVVWGHRLRRPTRSAPGDADEDAEEDEDAPATAASSTGGERA